MANPSQLIEPPENFLNYVKLAEKLGYEKAWYCDSQLIWMDTYAYLTMFALNTGRIKLGTQVTNPKTRHPAVTASAISTVNVISKGRAILGIGKGDSAVRTLGEKPATREQLIGAVQMIRALSEGRNYDYNRKKIKITWLQNGRKYKLPIYISATGPRILQLAGNMADGAIIYAGAHPSLVKWAVDHVRKGARETGRNFKEVDTTLLTAGFISDDIKKAKQEVQWCPAALANHVLDLLARHPRTNLPSDLIRDVERFKGGYDYFQHCENVADHAEIVTDDMIEKFTVVGRPKDCIERIASLEKAGIKEICIYLFSREKRYIVESFGKEVLPYFKESKRR